MPKNKRHPALVDPLQRQTSAAPADDAPWSLLGDIETTAPADNQGDVVAEETPAFQPHQYGEAAEKFLHASWWSQRQRLFAALSCSGASDKTVQRVRDCGKFATIERCSTTGEYRVRGSSCKHRFCRRCARQVQLRVADNLYKLMTNAELRCSHLVLTLKHRDQPFVTMRKRLYKCFKELRTLPIWQRAVRGGAAFCQQHVSESTGCWHVHFHVIVEHRYIAQEELSLAWREITGDSTNVYIERIDDEQKAAREACRYVASPVDKKTSESIAHYAEAIDGLRGARLCFTFGNWKGNRLHENNAEEEPLEWLLVGGLGAILLRAERGDEAAKAILEALTAKQHPHRGPPTLFHKPLYVGNVETPATR